MKKLSKRERKTLSLKFPIRQFYPQSLNYVDFHTIKDEIRDWFSETYRSQL